MSANENILVIKHGALGDIIIATASFDAIRRHHPKAHIVCLTTKPYAELLSNSGYFNEIWVDSKPRIHQRKATQRLRSRLNSLEWNFIYDLQTSQRSSGYWWLLKRPKPSFNGVARFASHAYRDKARHGKHALTNHKLQLEIAGIDAVGLPDLRWMQADISRFFPKPVTQSVRDSELGLLYANIIDTPPFSADSRYVLLVPGGAPHRPEKRWPAESFASLAAELADKKLVPVLIGSKAESGVLAQIAERVPSAVNLCGKTTIPELSVLARDAFLAIGNDTGPMHVIAASRCPSVVLFSKASNPKRSAPPGEHVHAVQRGSLADLSVDEVLTVIHGLRPLDMDT